MSGFEYLSNLIRSRANSNYYSQSEETAYSRICGWINEWKQAFYNSYNSAYSYYQNAINIETKKSGSRAKGTSLKGKSDIDIFVSITDSNNNNTAKDYYDSLYAFLKPKMTNNDIRKQNVSIGLNYAGCDIDVTPAKKINYSTYTYQSNNDHFLYSRKKDGLIKTNIDIHINLVKNSGLQNEIMLIKMWRNCHGLELPSIYIELLTTELLRGCYGNLENNVLTLLEALRDTVLTRRIVDPANSTNIISDTLTYAEKQAIAEAARTSRNQQYWSSIIW